MRVLRYTVCTTRRTCLNTVIFNWSLCMTVIPVTEQRNPASYQIDTKSTEEILTIINNEDKKVPYAVEGAIPELTKLIDCLVPLLKKGGNRIVMFETEGKTTPYVELCSEMKW